MAFEIKKPDERRMDVSLHSILEAHARGEVGLDQTIHMLGHLIMLAAADNEAEFKEWLDPVQVSAWIKDCKPTNEQ